MCCGVRLIYLLLITLNAYGFVLGRSVAFEQNRNLISAVSNHVNPVRIHPTYDADGNMRWDGRMWHTWDAENRLVRSEPGLGGATNGSVRVVNSYDHRHRRIQKRVEILTGRGAGYPMDPSQAGTWDVVETRMFIYDGWNLAAEVVVDAQTGTTNVTRYLWGPDLSGTLQGAGGVGGLLAVIRSDGTFFPCYDANGNITEYVDGSGNIRAHYEYSPFGEIIAQSGDLADTFKFRFSTKYYDAESQSYYYGYRHYAPKLGCWFNRDPIEERGGLNLYEFVGNNGVNQIDKNGLKITISYTQVHNHEKYIKGISGETTYKYKLIPEKIKSCENTGKVGEVWELDATISVTYYIWEKHPRRSHTVEHENVHVNNILYALHVIEANLMTGECLCPRCFNATAAHKTAIHKHAVAIQLYNDASFDCAEYGNPAMCLNMSRFYQNILSANQWCATTLKRMREACAK